MDGDGDPGADTDTDKDTERNSGMGGRCAGAGAVRAMGMWMVLALALVSTSPAVACSAFAASDEVAGAPTGVWRSENGGPTRNFRVTLEVGADGSARMVVDRPDGSSIEVSGTFRVDAGVGSSEARGFTLAKARGKVLRTPDGTETGETFPLPDRLGLFRVSGGELLIRMGAERPATLTGPEAEGDPSYLRMKSARGG